MKAIEFNDFGEADVLYLTDVPAPEIRPPDLLVRVHAAGVNRADQFGYIVAKMKARLDTAYPDSIRLNLPDYR